MVNSLSNSTNWTPCEGEFPIIAYTTFRELDYVPEDSMSVVQDCGFNVVLENPFATGNENNDNNGLDKEDSYYKNNYKAIRRILNSLKGTNLKLILGGWQLFSDVSTSSDLNTPYPENSNDSTYTYLKILERYVSNYKDEPNLGGWSVTDEPNEKFFDRLKSCCDKIRALDPNHIMMVNLPGGPTEAFMEIPNSTNSGEETPYNIKLEAYQRYLNDFVSKINPTILSYDLYPIHLVNGVDLKITIDGANEVRTITMNSLITDNSIEIGDARHVHYEAELRNFYNAFEIYSEKVSKLRKKNSKVNFWAFVQSLAFINSAFFKPDAQEQFMRYEAFSALAYGAQAILFWTYYHRASGPKETFMSALIGKERYLNESGTVVKRYYKKPQWYYAKNVISEIKKYSYIFLGCRTKCAHTGGDAFFVEATLCTHAGTSFGPLETIYDSFIGDGFLFSDIENNGSHYLMIVNHNPFKAQNIKFKFKNSFTYKSLRFKDINLDLTIPETPPSDSGIVSQIVPPGDYLLYSYV